MNNYSAAKNIGSRVSVRPVGRWVLRHWIRHEELVRVRQQIRYLAYAELRTRIDAANDLTLYELSVFSQNGEDGVLQEVFRRIGVSSRFFVEIGASANEANAVFLADVSGWAGVFCDSSPRESSDLSAKYRHSDRVKVVNMHVTPENCGCLIADHVEVEDVDLLSIDVDGNEYWLWKNLCCKMWRPRVVVIEYNSAVGPAARVVHPYQNKAWDGTNDTGSSMRSLTDLGESLGYRLVHAESTGVNLIFVRADVVCGNIFSEPDDILSRVPNHFLYGLHHPDKRGQGAMRSSTELIR